MSGQDTLFPALRDGVARLRVRVEGSEGDFRARLLQLAGRDGIASTVARAVLSTLAELLAWLHGAIDDIDRFLGQTDAAVAMLAVAGEGLQGLGEALEAQQWPEGFPNPGDTAGALIQLGSTLAGLAVADLPALAPGPALLAAIQADTRALLGARVDPQADPALGSLDRLIEEMDGSA